MNARGPQQELHPDRGFTVRPDLRRQGLGVFAVAAFAPGEEIGTFTGEATHIRTRMSLQFGPDLFVEPGAEEPLRNLNHACDPTAQFTGRTLVARRALNPGDAITIDYTLHEAEMSDPFQCACGASGCLGEVRGWRFLTPPQKDARRSRAGSWLSD